MIKTYKQLIILSVLLLFFCPIFIQKTMAAPPANDSDITINPLPTPYESGATPTDLMGYIKRLYLFGLGLVGIAALISLAYSGLQYITSSAVGSTEDAKKRIWNAILGIILALSAYLILWTINPDLVSLSEPITQGIAPIPSPGPGPGAGPGPEPEAGGLSDAEARDQLLDAGLTIKDGVNLDGIQQSTIDGLINLKEQCGCDINITSGTDNQHADDNCSHENGCKVDTSLSSDLNNFIEDNFDGPTQTLFGPVWCDSQGNSYLKEGNHWDMAFGARSSGICN